MFKKNDRGFSLLVSDYVRKNLFEGEPGAAPPAAPPAASPAAPPAAPSATGDDGFSPEQQEHVNALLAKQKRDNDSEKQELLNQVRAVKAKSELTVEERKEWEAKHAELRKQYMTKEQLAEEERQKSASAHEVAMKAVTEERDMWKARHTTSLIERSIMDAAVAGDAYEPSQVIRMLSSDTKLVEGVDAAGTPDGTLKPQVSFADVNTEGEAVNLTLSPAEAVKRMREKPEFMNLFQTEGAGGLGLMNSAQAPVSTDVAKLARDNTPEYIRLRKAGKIKHGSQ